MENHKLVTIAVDAMGGDYAPLEIVKGVAEISRTTSIQCVLVGDEHKIQDVLSSHSYNPANISVVHASEVIGMADDPKQGIAAKPNASIAVAAREVAHGKAHALVSAGNTGACVLACNKHFEKIPGVKRTALATVYPRRTSYRGQDMFALLLDVGANIRVDADDLVKFAVMGSGYASRISKVEKPVVGLLNIGTEPTKGGDVYVTAHQILASMPEINFIGNIEGKDIPTGRADVVVCDGFVGNVVVKFLEGVAEVAFDYLKDAYKKKLVWKLGLILLSRGIRQVVTVTDYRRYGGAPILGFKNIFIKAHGRSNSHAMVNAIKLAAKAVHHDVCGVISSTLQNYVK